jgi:hypothetical protein
MKLTCKKFKCEMGWWHTPVIPAIQEAEIERILVLG